jgi:hypothetical protein
MTLQFAEMPGIQEQMAGAGRRIVEREVTGLMRTGSVVLCFEVEHMKWTVARWCGDAYVVEARWKTRRVALRDFDAWVKRDAELLKARN